MEQKGPVDLSTTKVLSDSFFYSAARIATLVIRPIKGVILPKFLGPGLYGILSIPVPYILNGSMLSNLGFNTSVLKLMPGYLQQGRPDGARMIYRSSAFLTVALSSLWCALLLICSPWIARNVAHEPDVVNPMRLYALVIPFLSVNIFFASVYMAVQRGKLGAAIAFVYGVLNTILPIAAVVWRRNVTLVVGSILAAEAISALCYTLLFHRHVLNKLGDAIGSLWVGIKETVVFGFPFFLGGLGSTLINSVDRLMIKFYWEPPELLGYYSMAVQVPIALNVITATLGLALVPALTAAREAGERTVFQRLVHNSARLGFMTLVPICIAILALSGDVFALVLPAFGPSVVIVQILVGIGFIDLFCRIGWAGLVAHGKGGASAAAYLIAALWNVTWNRILIPPHGIVGAAVAALSTYVVLAVVLLALMKRASGAKIGAMSCIHPLLLSLVYPALTWLLAGTEPIVRLLVVICGGSLVYVFAALGTGLVRRQDFDRAREMLSPRAAVPHVRLALGAIRILDRLNARIGRDRRSPR